MWTWSCVVRVNQNCGPVPPLTSRPQLACGFVVGVSGIKGAAPPATLHHAPAHHAAVMPVRIHTSGGASGAPRHAPVPLQRRPPGPTSSTAAVPSVVPWDDVVWLSDDDAPVAPAGALHVPCLLLTGFSLLHGTR